MYRIPAMTKASAVSATQAPQPNVSGSSEITNRAGWIFIPSQALNR